MKTTLDDVVVQLRKLGFDCEWYAERKVRINAFESPGDLIRREVLIDKRNTDFCIARANVCKTVPAALGPVKVALVVCQMIMEGP